MAEKLIGSVGWSNLESVAEIDRAILRNGKQELAVEVRQNGWLYTAILERQENGTYTGNWNARKGADTDKGSASCQLCETTSGRIFVGEWSEGGSNFFWWGRLEAVEHFADEK